MRANAREGGAVGDQWKITVGRVSGGWQAEVWYTENGQRKFTVVTGKTSDELKAKLSYELMSMPMTVSRETQAT